MDMAKELGLDISGQTGGGAQNAETQQAQGGAAGTQNGSD
jgi:hypothetical protein